MATPLRLPGDRDIHSAVATLAGHLPPPLAALARLAYNYWWSWQPDGPALFESIDPSRWSRSGNNPVRLLQEVAPVTLARLAEDPAFLQRTRDLASALNLELHRPFAEPDEGAGPVAFFCAEFGVHRSLPFYAGGLGVLAGDLLKEASDQCRPVVGVGLFYAQGSFHQRLDTSGWQHEYWLDTDSDRLPAVLVTGQQGEPITVSVSIRGRPVLLQVWRVDIGRVQLYLLDSNVASNSPADRWITARLYVAHRDLRLAQYALLGIGGVRALRAIGIQPSLFHLNEGHAALALLELLGEQLRTGASLEEARRRIAPLTRFTTHTPVAAGNETFAEPDLRRMLPGVDSDLPWSELIALGRVHPQDDAEPFGLTPLALRLTGAANGVSRLHGEVSRSIWADVWPGRRVEDIPISHVTNGVHVPTWMAAPMAALLARHIPRWDQRPSAPGDWDAILDIPDEELWEIRCELRRALGRVVRERSVVERLGRGESIAYAESMASAWDDHVLTIGFARRIATYKRLYLVTRNPERGARLLTSATPVQMVIAGRAHPSDDAAKVTVQQVFALNEIPAVGSRAIFLEEHDLGLAARLVQGCDLWVNLPRPRQEASGTSGMKSVLNGGLQLSVLDGWWAEAYAEGNGWAVASDPNLLPEEQDARDTEAFFGLLESEVVPLFYDRDATGVPGGWIRRIKDSMRAHGPAFSATRMLRDYAERAWTRT